MTSPAKSEFANDGFFETVFDEVTGKVLGTRHGITPAQGRVMGFNGLEKSTVEQPLTLTRGHRQITIKASPAKPLKISTIVFPQSGRMVAKHPLEK